MAKKFTPKSQWVLTTEHGEYATLKESFPPVCILTFTKSEALVFDERANEVMKSKYYGAVLSRSFITEPV